MTYKTHATGGIALGTLLISSPLASVLNPDLSLNATESIAILTIAGVGGLLPDIDTPHSYLGRRIPFFHKLKHRGFTHSLFFVGIIFLLLYLSLTYFEVSHLKGLNIVIPVALSLGILSHILLDMLNSPGVQLLYPKKKRMRFLKIKTGGIGEILVLMVMLAYLVLFFR